MTDMIEVYSNHFGFCVELEMQSGKFISLAAQRRTVLEEAHFDILLYDCMEQIEPTAQITISDMSVGPLLAMISASRDCRIVSESGKKLIFSAIKQAFAIYENEHTKIPSAWCICPRLIRALQRMEICSGFTRALGMMSPTLAF